MRIDEDIHLVVVSSSATAWVLVSVADLGDMVVDAFREDALLTTVARTTITIVNNLKPALVIKLTDTLVSDFGSNLNQFINLILAETISTGPNKEIRRINKPFANTQRCRRSCRFPHKDNPSPRWHLG